MTAINRGPHWQCSEHPSGIRYAEHNNAYGFVALDCTINMFDITQTGDIEFSFSHVPRIAVITIFIKRTGPFSETWPASVSYTEDVAPAPSAENGLEDAYTLITRNGGARWRLIPFIQGAAV